MSFWKTVQWILNPIGMGIGKAKEAKLKKDLKKVPPYTVVSGGTSLGFTPVSLTYQSFNPIAQKEYEWQNHLNLKLMDSILNPNLEPEPTDLSNLVNHTVEEPIINDNTKVVDQPTADVINTINPDANVVGSKTLELNNNIAYVGLGLLAFAFLLKR